MSIPDSQVRPTRSVGGVIFATLVVLGLAGLIGWRIRTKQALSAELQKTQAARKGMAPNVVLATAGPKRLLEELEVVGTVESPVTVKLSPKLNGRIEYLKVREGAAVHPSELLVRLDPGDLKAAILQQEATVVQARARLAQARATQGTTSVTVVSGIEQQRAAANSAKADFEQVTTNFASQVAAGQANVADAQAKVQAASFDIATARADLASVEASEANAKTRLRRAESLFKEGFAAAQAVDDARTALSVQTALVASAKSKIAAAESALTSAQAQLVAAQNQSAILKKKALAEIEASRARQQQVQSSLKLANANKAQTAAYTENLAALAQAVMIAEAQLAQARARLADTELTASIDGVVTARLADEGSLATVGQPLLTIQYLKWVYVSASVPVEQSGRVSRGTKVKITLDSVPGAVFETRVAEINPTADPQSRQFMVRVKLDNADGRLRPGMYARARLELRDTAAAVVVPRDAIKTVKGETTVTAVGADDVATIKPVVLGVSNSGEVEITSGLAAGERVVVLAYQPVKDGQKIRTAPKEAKETKEAKEKGKP